MACFQCTSRIKAIRTITKAPLTRGAFVRLRVFPKEIIRTDIYFAKLQFSKASQPAFAYLQINAQQTPSTKINTNQLLKNLIPHYLYLFNSGTPVANVVTHAQPTDLPILRIKR